VDAMLGIELEQTRVYREAEQQGEMKATQALILRLLNRRVGNVSPAVEMRVKALPLLRLEDLGEALLDFSQMSDLMAWLDANQSDRGS
jgi:predicted transposase YdaD